LKDVSQSNPDNESFRFALGQAYEYSGPMLEKAGDRQQAQQDYRLAIAIFQEAAVADPKDELAHRFLGFTYQYAGKLLVREGDVPGGLADLHQALAIFQPIVQPRPENDFVLSGTAETYAGMGMAEAALASDKKLPAAQRAQHWREAAGWYKKSLDIWIKMRDRGALALVDVHKPDELTREIAACNDRALRP
jgi:tetratricopeptide (TPR) repeat protein